MEFIILGFATFALTSALTGSDGPFGLFYKLRKLKQAKVLECFLCSAVLVGALFALRGSDNVIDWLIVAFALGGFAYFSYKLSNLDF